MKKHKGTFFLNFMKNFKRNDGFLFGVLIALEIIFFSFLIGERRFPAGHDSFEYFVLQYYFLNNAVINGELPLWLPYVTHGVDTQWLYPIQAGFFQNILCLVAPLLKHVNFLFLFYLGIFVDEILLLVGIWLLGKRFFQSSLTVFLVSLLILNSSIWMTQIWWNLHFFYAIPLILHFGHCFIEKQNWGYLCLALSLLACQILGNLTYFIPVSTLVIFSYFAFYEICNLTDAKFFLRKIKITKLGILGILFVLLVWVLIYFTVRIDFDNFISYQRPLSISVSLENFLNHGKNFEIKKWSELFLRISPSLDYTLYIGMVGLPFSVLGIFACLRRKNAYFYLFSLVLFLFSMGSFVARWAYYFWPMMKYFRHVGFVSIIFKLCLCFFAGMGFEFLFFKKHSVEKEKSIKMFLLATCLLLVILGFNLAFLSSDSQEMKNFLETIIHSGQGGIPKFQIIFTSHNLALAVKQAFFFLMATAFFLCLLTVNRFRPYRHFLIYGIVLLCVFDIYGYKWREATLRTFPMNQEQYDMLHFRSMIYRNRRDAPYTRIHPREKFLTKDLFKSGGIIHCETNGFLFKDEIGTSHRVMQWLPAFDRLLRAYWHLPLGNLAILPKGLIFSGYTNWLVFPLEHKAAGKIAGLTENKIQFFKNAYGFLDDDSIASLLIDEKYNGDLLFISGEKKYQNLAPGLKLWDAGYNLEKNERLDLSYKIKRFEANFFELDVDVKNSSGVWMLYSDVWHPSWKGKINGREKFIFRANLAYKAIKLDAGVNNVKFKYQDSFKKILHFFWGIFSLFFIIIVFYYAGRILIL